MNCSAPAVLAVLRATLTVGSASQPGIRSRSVSGCASPPAAGATASDTSGLFGHSVCSRSVAPPIVASACAYRSTETASLALS